MKKLLLVALLIIGIAVIPGFYKNSGDVVLAGIDNNALNQISGKTLSKQFNVKPGQKLYIDMRTGASIQIEGWDKDLLTADVDARGRSADDIDFDFKQTSDGVEITSEYAGDNDNSSDVEIILKVPSKFDVEYETMGGDVKINNVDGKLEGRTMGGELILSNLKGMLNMTTMGGKIELTDSDVDGRVETMGGSVLVQDVTGDIDAKSMGGNVVQKNVKGRTGKSSGKEVRITTMGGNLDLDDAPNGAYLKTMGGDINVNSVKKYLEAETMGGEINVQSIDGKIKAKTMGGDVDVKMTGNPDEGDRSVTLTSMGGDITLSVPANLSMSFDIEIAYTRKGEDRARIESDFKMNEEHSKEWDYNHGSKRKYIYGTGEVNGGKNKIRIRTVNGTVTIKKI